MLSYLFVIKLKLLLVLILTLPILFNWFKVARKPTTRWKLKAYIEGLLCQFLVPVYAWKSLRAPDNVHLKEKLWSLKVSKCNTECFSSD